MINWPTGSDSLIQLYNYDPLFPGKDPNDLNHYQFLKADTANKLGSLITNLQTVLKRATVCGNENNTVFIEMAYQLQIGPWEAMNFPRFITCTNVFHLESLSFFPRVIANSLCNKKSISYFEESWPGLSSDCRISSGVYLTRTLDLPPGQIASQEFPIGSYPVAVAHNLYTDFTSQEVRMVTWWNKPLENFLLGPAFVTNTGGSSSTPLAFTNRNYREYDHEYMSERTSLLNAAPVTYDSITYNKTAEIVFHLMIQDFS